MCCTLSPLANVEAEAEDNYLETYGELPTTRVNAQGGDEYLSLGNPNLSLGDYGASPMKRPSFMVREPDVDNEVYEGFADGVLEDDDNDGEDDDDSDGDEEIDGFGDNNNDDDASEGSFPGQVQSTEAPLDQAAEIAALEAALSRARQQRAPASPKSGAVAVPGYIASPGGTTGAF